MEMLQLMFWRRSDSASSSKKADYDPYQHRNVENPASNFEALVYLWKSSLGIAVVAMPKAFKCAGYVNGVIFTSVIGFVTIYAMHILLRTMYIVCKRNRVGYMTYPVAMEAALMTGPPFLQCYASIARCFVYSLLSLYHFSICILYVIFIAENLREIHLTVHNREEDVRFYVVAAAFPLLLIYSITGLRTLTWLYILANVLQIFTFSCLFYFIITHDDSNTVRYPFASLKTLPLFYGIVIFSIEAIGVLLTIEERMKTPKSFLGFYGIMNISMLLVVLCNIAMGFLGYWNYGEDVKGSVTLNLPHSDLLSVLTKSTFAVSIVISYALQGYVTVDVFWTRYLKFYVEDYNYRRYEIAIRGGIAVATFFCAIMIPNFTHFLALTGSFFLSILGLILPPIMEICVKYPDDYGPYRYVIVRNCSIALCGVFGGIIGIYTSLFKIVKSYDEDD